MNRIAIALTGLLLASTAAADELIIAYPNGDTLVFDGTLIDVRPGATGGMVFFDASGPPDHIGLDGVLSSGFDAAAWGWWIQFPDGHETGIALCEFTQPDTATIVLTCANG